MIPSTEKCRAENEMTVNKGKEPVMLNVKSEVTVFIAQLCPTLCNPMDCSLPGSSVSGILQAKILEWVAIPFSKGSSKPRSPTLQIYSLLSESPGKIDDKYKLGCN